MLVLININMRLTCSDVYMISHHIINMVVGLCYNVVPINILLKWSTVLMAYYNQPFFLSVHDVYLKVTLVGFSDSVASLEVPGLRAMISLQLLYDKFTGKCSHTDSALVTYTASSLCTC